MVDKRLNYMVKTTNLNMKYPLLLNQEKLILAHADMPNNGHDKVYRERERQFVPSKIAEKGAKEFDEQYEYDANVSYYWYTVSNQFLDTIHWDYKIEAMK